MTQLATLCAMGTLFSERKIKLPFWDLGVGACLTHHQQELPTKEVGVCLCSVLQAVVQLLIPYPIVSRGVSFHRLPSLHFYS